MKTEKYNDFTIVVTDHRKGYCIIVSIDKYWKGEDDARDFKEEILTFGNHFDTDEEVTKFKQSKMFERVYKAIKKSYGK